MLRAACLPARKPRCSHLSLPGRLLNKSGRYWFQTPSALPFAHGLPLLYLCCFAAFLAALCDGACAVAQKAPTSAVLSQPQSSITDLFGDWHGWLPGGSYGSPDLALFVRWRPDWDAYPAPLDFDHFARATGGDVGGRMGIAVRTKEWLDYHVDPVAPMQGPFGPTDQWLCHIVYTRVDMKCDEIRVHENAGTVADLVATDVYANAAVGDPNYGEQEYFTYDLGLFHFQQPAYLEARTGWPTIAYVPEATPPNGNHYPNGGYAVTAKVQYRTLHADYYVALTLDQSGPIGGGSSGGGFPPSGGSLGGGMHLFDFGGGIGGPGGFGGIGVGFWDDWGMSPRDEVPSPWQAKTLNLTPNLVNIVVDTTLPENPAPIVWDPDTMTQFPLKVGMKTAYRSLRELDVDLFNTKGEKVNTLRKLFWGKQDTIDFHWDGHLTNPDGSQGTQLPSGLYFFKCTAVARDGEPVDEWSDKSAFMRYVQTPSPDAALISEDDTTSTYELQYRFMYNTNFVMRPAASGTIDVYGPDLTKVFSRPMTSDELTPGSHTVRVSMPTPPDSGVYTFVITPQDDYADVDKRHVCQFPVQASQSIIKWETVSGTNVGEKVRSWRTSGIITIMYVTFTNYDSNKVEGVLPFVGPFGKDVTHEYAWDSTHFPDGTRLVIKLTSLPAASPMGDLLGNSKRNPKYVQVYNKGYVLANAHHGNATLDADAVDQQVRAMNHTTRKNFTDTKAIILDGDAADKTTTLRGLADFTMFYICTHGGPGRFLDCPTLRPRQDQPIPPDYESLHVLKAFNDPDAPKRSVADAVRDKNKRHPNVPDYNFVFLDGCSCGQTDELANAFNVAGSLLAANPDHAFLGWKVKILADRQHDKWVKAFFGYLGTGTTVELAARACNRSFVITGHNDDGSIVTNENNNDIHKFYGDLKTKLHGVYGGSDAQQWYIVK